ncbi:phage tail length tape measure family protein [Sagittula sp. NFXS13]|uniref:phage tail length tape measure family protein n=1 Tax=Sagittula sp. NFXS13 TaxID=2819095 RepID=UPI0032DF6FA9
MAFRVSGKITADGKQAQAELRRTETGVTDLGNAAEKTGKQGKSASTGLATVGRATDEIGKRAPPAVSAMDGLGKSVQTTGAQAQKTDAATDALTTALQAHKAELARLQTKYKGTVVDLDAVRAKMVALEAQGKKLPKTYNAAAGSVGNLTSQFNDIGVMMAAGQNPLQLAIQQGTQIGQVFQQSGAKGKDAAKLILSGFTAMVSPINLITIGSIAAAAAMTNWLTSSSAEAEDLEDVLERLSGRVTGLKNDAALSADAIRKEFGGLSPALSKMLAEIRDRELDAIQRDATKAAKSLIQDVAGAALAISQQARREGDFAGREAIKGALSDLYNAETLDDQIKAVEQLKSTVAGVAVGLKGVEERQIAFRNAVLDTERALRQGQTAGNAVFDALKEGWTASLAKVREYGAERLKVHREGTDLLLQLQHENDLRAIAAKYGEDSVQYMVAQEEAQRAVFEELVASLDIAESFKDEIRRAYEEGSAFGSLDMSSGLREAVGLAAQLAVNLANARAQSITELDRAQLNWDYRDDPVGKAGALARNEFDANVGTADFSGLDPILQTSLQQQREEYVANAEAVEQLRQKTVDYAREQAKLAKSTGSKRGGKSRTKEERDEVGELISGYQQRLAILRETDPVQKELLRHADALTKATQAQTDAVRSKISALQSEEAMHQRIDAMQDFSGQLFMAGIDAMRARGDAAAQAWAQVGNMVQQALMQAAILGSGPLGGMLGGGLIPGLFGLLGFADGGDTGMIYGPGGSRDDRVPFMTSQGRLITTSPGEFIVNSDATAKHRALLEAINSGAPMPGFASGGATGGGNYPAQALHVELVDGTNRGITATRREDRIDSAGRRYPRFEISDVVGQGLSTPGGGAAALLKSKGLGPMGPKR